MPNIFNEKPKLLSTGYYEGPNIFGRFFVKHVMSELDYLENHIDVLNSKIESLGDLHQYFWCLSFKKMDKDLYGYIIDNSLKIRIKNLASKLIDNKRSFVCFVNTHYREIFKENKDKNSRWIILFKNTTNLCFLMRKNGINKEVLTYLSNNHALRMLTHFDICRSYYLENNEEFKLLFKDLEKTRNFDDNIYSDFLIRQKDFKYKDDFLNDKAKFICERNLKALYAMNINSDNEAIIAMREMTYKYRRLANLYQLKCATDYGKLLAKIDKGIDEFVIKHGQRHKIGPYNFDDAAKILKNSNDPWRFIQITHGIKNKKVINCLDDIINAKKPKNADLINRLGEHKSDKYPFYLQDWISTNLKIRSYVLMRLFYDKDLLNPFVNYIYNVCIKVQEVYFKNEINIEDEISGIVDVIVAMMELGKEKRAESTYFRSLVDGCSMSICATIEKILRNIVIKENKDVVYIDEEKASLSQLLSDKYKTKDISIGTERFIEFYLSKETNLKERFREDRPGLDFRNRIMHGKNDAHEKNSFEACISVFYLLLSLLDDLLVTFIFKD